MGNLSENFNNKDFTCKCELCKGGGEYKIHLGLVGALEMLTSYFKKRPRILLGYRCEDSIDKIAGGGTKRSIHALGKAAHIQIEGVSLGDLYKYVKDLSEIRGIGVYPKEDFLHVDTRTGERVEWVKEGDSYTPLTAEKKKLYGLI